MRKEEEEEEEEEVQVVSAYQVEWQCLSAEHV